MFSGLVDSFHSGVNRILISGALTGTPYTGNTAVAEHWYARHDRLGEYGGTFCKQATDVYDILDKALSGSILQDQDYSGANSGALGAYYTGAEIILSGSYAMLQETIEKGGMLDPDIAKLFYGYAWFIRWSMEKGEFTPPGTVPNTTFFTGSGEFQSGDAALLYGLLKTGLDVMVKGMTTTEGYIYETTVVDQASGPFAAKVPQSILETLGKASTIDTTFYPLTQAVFNTVTGRFDYGGYYPVNAIDTAAPADLTGIAYSLAKVYKYIHPLFPIPDATGLARSV